MRDPMKLKAFHLADSLAIAIYKASAAMPRSELFGLTSQIRRAAFSVPSNIVEGCSRHTHADYLHFLDIAYGSARELQYQLSVIKRLGLLDAQTSDHLATSAEETGRVLNGLIQALRAKAKT